MFLPNRTTQRELDIQKRRDPAAEKEDIWNPNEWKRFFGQCPGWGRCGAFVGGLFFDFEAIRTEFGPKRLL